jgi:glycolate oxidase FAD binding subunit
VTGGKASGPVLAFAGEVGGVDAGPVVAVGGRSAPLLGGPVPASAREVRAPVGVVDHQAAEMTVRVLAGTPVADVDEAVGAAGQCVAIASRAPEATVGGALAVGRSGLRRLGWGPVRDTVLEVTAVTAAGRVVRAGGPTVKNVTGYDLCRLLVGSLGTLAILAEVVLRTRPRPAFEQWFVAPPGTAPAIWRSLHKPVSACWDGTTTWMLLAGHPDDVAAQATAHGLEPSAGAPPTDGLEHRWSLPAADLAALPDDGAGPFLAELGVGVVHRQTPPPRRPVDPAVRAVHDRLKASFDPTGRLAPGRQVLP